MEKIVQSLLDALSGFGLNLVYALVVLFIGNRIITLLMKRFMKLRTVQRMDRGLATFLHSFGNIVFYIVLVIICCGIVGIPASSFVTVLASAGVAIGLAVQGVLGNFAGGLMILFFKPFAVGDYIEASGFSGTVSAIQTFYTVLLTPDNKRVTMPNSLLTNAAVVDYSAEEYRRLDLVFYAAVTHSGDEVKRIIQEVLDHTEGFDRDREVLVRMSCQMKGQLDFAVRVWCKNEDYWTLYYDLNENIHRALEEHHIQPPASLITLGGSSKLINVEEKE